MKTEVICPHGGMAVWMNEDGVLRWWCDDPKQGVRHVQRELRAMLEQKLAHPATLKKMLDCATSMRVSEPEVHREAKAKDEKGEAKEGEKGHEGVS